MNKNIVLLSLAASTSFFFLMYVFMFNKFRNSLNQLQKLSVDNVVMQEYIDILKSKEEPIVSDELIDKENFIKFLSDSRDWAYKYIEDVQLGLTEFVNDVDKHIKHFDQYGETLSIERPDYDKLKAISESYKKLILLLPMEQDEK